MSTSFSCSNVRFFSSRLSGRRLRKALIAGVTGLALASGTLAAQPVYAHAALEKDDVNYIDGIPDYMNNWSCRSRQHPVPVIMLHGTFSRQANQIDVTHMLHRQGFCVYGANVGHDDDNLMTQIDPTYYGMGDIHETVEQVHEFINLVKKKTGARQVDLIGHSQGGLIIRSIITRYGSSDIRVAIPLGGTQNGTTLGSLTDYIQPLTPEHVDLVLSPITGPAVAQQMVGSEYIKELDKHPNTAPGVTYVVLVSPDDTQSTPYKRGFLTPVPGSKVYNIDVKAYCGIPKDVTLGHSDLHIHPAALSLILWGLSSATQKNARPVCTLKV